MVLFMICIALISLRMIRIVVRAVICGLGSPSFSKGGSTLRDDHISLPKRPLALAIGYISCLLCTSPKRCRGLLPADSVRAAQLSLLSQMLLGETLRPGVHQTSTQSLVAFLSTSQQVVLCSFAGGNHWDIIVMLIKCTASCIMLSWTDPL